MDTRTRLQTLAAEYGFVTVRFAQVDRTPHIDVFDRWLAADKHGDMTYLARGRDLRADPRRAMPSAQTAVVLAMQHHHRRPPDPGGRTGLVARYAWGRDYHNLIGKRLKKLRRQLRLEGIESWGGVDTPPILERSWATTAGMGFSGKNGVQILPARTSWLLLAVLFIDREVPPDPPLVKDHCGRCTRCLTACPTNAFDGPRDLDARRCIAYWTIESRQLPPRSLRPGFGRWVFGCDVCQEVCPHNAAPPESDEDDFLPRHAYLDLDLLLMTPDAPLMEKFLGTPLRRPGAAGLKRNAAIVLGNLGDDGAVPALRHALHHPSPVVRGAAVWALRQLDAAVPPTDPDPLVRAEIAAPVTPRPQVPPSE